MRTKHRGEKMRYQENKIVDSFKNTSEQAITKWGNDFIINNLPKALDCMVAKFKESVLTVSKNENNKMNEQIRDIIFKGIEIGEDNKEVAIIKAMKNAGMDENTIQMIIENSNKYLCTRTDYENSVIEK